MTWQYIVSGGSLFIGFLALVVLGLGIYFAVRATRATPPRRAPWWAILMMVFGGLGIFLFCCLGTSVPWLIGGTSPKPVETARPTAIVQATVPPTGPNPTARPGNPEPTAQPGDRCSAFRLGTVYMTDDVIGTQRYADLAAQWGISPSGAGDYDTDGNGCPEYRIRVFSTGSGLVNAVPERSPRSDGKYHWMWAPDPEGFLDMGWQPKASIEVHDYLIVIDW